MISMKLQITLLISCLFFLFIVINMIVKQKLELKYSLLWILLNVSTIIVAAVPQSALLISKMIDIEKPVNALFLIGIFLILLIMFSLTITLSNNQNKIKELSQELGISKLKLAQAIERLNNIDEHYNERKNINNGG